MLHLGRCTGTIGFAFVMNDTWVDARRTISLKVLTQIHSQHLESAPRDDNSNSTVYDLCVTHLVWRLNLGTY